MLHDERPPLTLYDLPQSHAPGEPGWRRVYDSRTGSVYTAVPYMNWGTSNYALPRVQERREWDQLHKAGGRQYHDTLRQPLCACARCKVLIGRGFQHQELYLEPYLKGDMRKQKVAVEWRNICGTNALEYGINQSFCLVSEADWIAFDRQPHTIHHQLATARAAKIARMFPTFSRGWQSFHRKQQVAYWELRSAWAQSTDRRALWREVGPLWRPYLHHYRLLHIRNWWGNYDKNGYGCAEHHLRPRDCVTGYHERLFALDIYSSFAAYRSMFQFETWTIQHSLKEIAA
jgi:hypothetical protein